MDKMVSENNTDFAIFTKVVIFGSSGVGKRSFLFQIENGTFPESEPYEGEELDTKRLKIKAKDGKEKWIDFYLYELVSNQLRENESELINDYLFQCQCVLFFIDITSSTSFENLKAAKNCINFSDYPDSHFFFVVNKIDLEERRKVSDYEIKDYLHNEGKGFKYFEISIKKTKNVRNLINHIYLSTFASSIKIPCNAIAKFTSSFSIAREKFSKSINNLTLVMIGDSAVGKTSFSKRYFRSDFSLVFMMTIGISDETAFIKIGDEYQKFTLWDTAGQERFRSLPKTYYTKADGILILFDLTVQKSFDNLEKGWMDEIKEKAKQKINDNSKFIVYLIGNKADMIDKRVVSKEMAKEKAKSLGLKYFETSCKLNLNIVEVINNMLMELNNNNNEDKNVFVLEDKELDQEKGCCR